MNRKISNLLILFVLLTLSGCAASSVTKAVKKGATVLDADAIFNLVSGNTLRLVASDFDAHVFYNPDGVLSASSVFIRNLDSGGWDIKSDNKLCIKFAVWYYGDVNCYSVYKDGDSDNYLLFTDNGSLAYTAAFFPGNPQHLKVKTTKETNATFIRKDLVQGQDASQPPPAPAAEPAPTPAPAPKQEQVSNSGPGASSKEINYTVKTMAKDCPGCNLKEADLRKANLIGANLKGANLSGADLSRANLRRANLEGADLSGATLLSTNLPGANLKDADLSGADLTGSNLIQADLTDATLENTVLDNTLQEGVKGLKK